MSPVEQADQELETVIRELAMRIVVRAWENSNTCGKSPTASVIDMG
jgi:hypothetical protein